MKNKLPPLTSPQRRVLRDVIDAGENSIVEAKTYSSLYYTKHTWGFHWDSPSGLVWIHRQHAPTLRALIRKGILVPEISDKEFSIQYALGILDIRRYRLTNVRKWKVSLLLL